MNNRFFIYRYTAVSHRDFITFWAQHYTDTKEDDLLYTPSILAEHTKHTLRQLFQWKVGVRLFQHQLPSLSKNFIDRIEEARCQPPDVCPEKFLNIFESGGAIYRIFWLHCWFPNRFPIYDQHVHRAMIYINEGRQEELDSFNDKNKIAQYINQYLIFRKNFSEIDDRSVDRALWAFGKWLKTSIFPLPI
jgi:hypothetical protein